MFRRSKPTRQTRNIFKVIPPTYLPSPSPPNPRMNLSNLTPLSSLFIRPHPSKCRNSETTLIESRNPHQGVRIYRLSPPLLQCNNLVCMYPSLMSLPNLDPITERNTHLCFFNAKNQKQCFCRGSRQRSLLTIRTPIASTLTLRAGGKCVIASVSGSLDHGPSPVERTMPRDRSEEKRRSSKNAVYCPFLDILTMRNKYRVIVENLWVC